MESDEKLPKMHGHIGIDYNQYVLDYLSRYMDEFPVKQSKSLGYSKEEIETARTFLRNYKSK